MALGDFDGASSVNVSSNSQSSSLLKMTDQHKTADPSSRYVGSEEIQVRKIDTVFDTLYKRGDTVFLKMDVQGMEAAVLRGSEQSLRHIHFVQAELSFVELYSGETLFEDYVCIMKDKGYRIVYVDQAFSDNSTAFAMQCDVIFFKEHL